MINLGVAEVFKWFLENTNTLYCPEITTRGRLWFSLSMQAQASVCLLPRISRSKALRSSHYMWKEDIIARVLLFGSLTVTETVLFNKMENVGELFAYKEDMRVSQIFSGITVALLQNLRIKSDWFSVTYGIVNLSKTSQGIIKLLPTLWNLTELHNIYLYIYGLGRRFYPQLYFYEKQNTWNDLGLRYVCILGYVSIPVAHTEEHSQQHQGHGFDSGNELIKWPSMQCNVC